MKPAWSPSLLRMLAVAVAIGVGVLVFFGSRAQHPGRASDKALESALLAPCCFGGTLDTHDSDIAHDLRAEIETRYARGESTASIENDMVARYTDRVRAMPNERAFTVVPAIAAGVATLGIALLGLFVLRLRKAEVERERARADLAPGAAPPTARDAADAYDARIDAELAEAD